MPTMKREIRLLIFLSISGEAYPIFFIHGQCSVHIKIYTYILFKYFYRVINTSYVYLFILKILV